jgi:hypothetical protein
LEIICDLFFVNCHSRIDIFIQSAGFISNFAVEPGRQVGRFKNQKEFEQ